MKYSLSQQDPRLLGEVGDLRQAREGVDKRLYLSRKVRYLSENKNKDGNLADYLSADKVWH